MSEIPPNMNESQTNINCDEVLIESSNPVVPGGSNLISKLSEEQSEDRQICISDLPSNKMMRTITQRRNVKSRSSSSHTQCHERKPENFSVLEYSDLEKDRDQDVFRITNARNLKQNQVPSMKNLKNSCLFLRDKVEKVKQYNLEDEPWSGLEKAQRYLSEFNHENLNGVTTFINWFFQRDINQMGEKYGNGVLNYCILSRFIFFLNTFLFVVFSFFVVVPQMIYNYYPSRTAYATNNFSYISMMENSGLPIEIFSSSVFNSPNELSCRLSAVPQPTWKNNFLSNLLSFFTGMEPFSSIFMFYCSFHNGPVRLGNLIYHLPHAYAITWCACMSLSIWLFTCIYVPSLRSTITGFSLLMGTWSFSAYEASDVKYLRHKLARSTKASLLNARMLKSEKNMSIDIKRRIKIIRWVCWFFTAVFYILTILAITFTSWWQLRNSNKQTNPYVNLVFEKATILVMAACKLVFEYSIDVLLMFEHYTPTTKVWVCVFRKFVLQVISFGTVIINEYMTEQTCANCWENRVASKIWTNFWIDVIQMHFKILFHLSLSICFRKFQEFNLSGGLLYIVTDQMFCWFGLFYAPILPLMYSLKYLYILFIQKLILSFLKIPIIQYDGDDLNSLNLKMLQIAYILAVAFNAFGFSHKIPSCGGPYGPEFCKNGIMISNILSSIQSSMPKVLNYIVFIFRSSPFVFLLFSLLCFLCLHYRSKMIGFERQDKSRRSQLKLIAEDRKFLIKKLQTQIRIPRASKLPSEA